MLVYHSPDGHTVTLAETRKKPNQLFLTKVQVLEMINISGSTLNKWIAQRKIPYYKVGDHRHSRVLFDCREVLEFMKTFRVDVK